MPTVVESLWDALKTNQFYVAKKLIQDNPKDELFNSTHAGLSVLTMCFMKKPLPVDFIRFLAAQPKLNLQYQNPKKTNTNISCLIMTGSVEVFALFEKRPEIIFNCGELSYVEAKKSLALINKFYASDCKENPHSETAKANAKRLEGIKIIFAKIRELTIRHAVNTDDPSLFEQLEKAGDDLDKPLSDGVLPIRLLNRTHVKVGEWFEKRFARSLESTPRLSENPHVMEMFKAEAALKQLTLNHHQKQAALYAKGAEAADNIVRSVARSKKEEESVSSASTVCECIIS